MAEVFNNTWGILGDIRFQPESAPRALSAKEKAKIVPIPSILGKDTLQYLGETNRKITMTFGFSYGWCVPAAELKRLQEAMRAAQPMFLGVGQGRFNGYYVIESLGSTVQSTLDTGEISSLSVKVELMETLDKPESKGNKSEPYVEVR